jgi:hypothetical protein
MILRGETNPLLDEKEKMANPRPKSPLGLGTEILSRFGTLLYSITC